MYTYEVFICMYVAMYMCMHQHVFMCGRVEDECYGKVQQVNQIVQEMYTTHENSMIQRELISARTEAVDATSPSRIQMENFLKQTQDEHTAIQREKDELRASYERHQTELNTGMKPYHINYVCMYE